MTAKPEPSNCLEIVSSLDPRFGGVSTSLPQQAIAISAQGRYCESILVISVASQTYANPTLDHIPIFNTSVHPLESLYNGPVSAVLAHHFQSAELLHIHGIWEPHCAISSRWARRLRKPYIVSAHGMLEAWALRNKRSKKSIYSTLIEKRNLRMATCLRALSQAELEDFRHFGLRVPVAVIPLGIPPPPEVTPDQFLEAFPHLRHRRLLLFLGRIHYKKGLALLCRAWANVCHHFPDAHLVLAGPDFENTRQSVEALIDELAIREHVTFTGMLAGDLKWSALRAAQAFVLPSYSEGLSVAALEALASGTPVILTRQCNLTGITDRGCGWLIDPDLRQIETALSDLLCSSSAQTRHMGDSGRRLVEDRYSWTVVARQLANLYDWGLGGPRPSEVEIL